MRFLCLHGLATNADIFETQTATLREQLADNHEFDFPEGEYEFPPTKEIRDIYPGPYLSWHPVHRVEANVNQGMQDIKEYITENGPYDGAMGFSQGAVMLAALILEHQQLHPFDPPPFQVAIFFSGSMYERETLLTRGGAKIKIPTAHILGGRRDFQYDGALELRDACEKELRSEFEHGEGHTIPRKKELVLGMASTIRNSINRAIYKS